MSLDFGTLQVERAIIHQIPKRLSSEGAVALRTTDIEIPPVLESMNFLAERIKESLVKSSYSVAFDPEPESPVPDLISRLFESENDDFVHISQRIALHLYTSQTGVNSRGVLVITQVKLENKPALAILKLEDEKGCEYEILENNKGLITCSLKQVENLMLTGGKIFKVGIFVKESDCIAGCISDKQRGIKTQTLVANFFLKRFLGCYLLKSPAITTNQFIRTCQNFINNDVSSVELKQRYEIALLSLINNNNDVIEPTNFASLNMHVDDRQKFIDRLEQDEVPTTNFEKDISTTGNSIRNMHVTFTNNECTVAISGNASSLEDLIIEETDDGRVKVSFVAELDKFGK